MSFGEALAIKSHLRERAALLKSVSVQWTPLGLSFLILKMTTRFLCLPLTAIWTLSRISPHPATWKRTRWTWGVRLLSPFRRPRRAQSNYISKRSAAAFTQRRTRGRGGGENRQIKCGAEYSLLCKLQRTKRSRCRADLKRRRVEIKASAQNTYKSGLQSSQYILDHFSCHLLQITRIWINWTNLQGKFRHIQATFPGLRHISRQYRVDVLIPQSTASQKPCYQIQEAHRGFEDTPICVESLKPYLFSSFKTWKVKGQHSSLNTQNHF